MEGENTQMCKEVGLLHFALQCLQQNQGACLTSSVEGYTLLASSKTRLCKPALVNCKDWDVQCSNVWVWECACVVLASYCYCDQLPQIKWIIASQICYPVILKVRSKK